jgi:transcriptional regulator with XRE-family HTH domain
VSISSGNGQYGLPDKARAKINTRILYMRAMPVWPEQYVSALKGWPELVELRIVSAGNQYRPLGFYLPQRRRFALVLGAMEKGKLPKECWRPRMRIERSSLQTQADFANTSSIKGQMLDALQSSKEYRHGFVEESIGTRITAQIKALRQARAWDYKHFAEQINKKVSWTYRLEDPNAPPPTIPTLLEVAAAFDVGLDVRFRPFSELLHDVVTLGPDSFIVPSFDEELSIGSFVKRKHRTHGRRCRTRPRRKTKLSSAAQRRPHTGESNASIGAASPPFAQVA